MLYDDVFTLKRFLCKYITNSPLLSLQFKKLPACLLCTGPAFRELSGSRKDCRLVSAWPKLYSNMFRPSRENRPVTLKNCYLKSSLIFSQIWPVFKEAPFPKTVRNGTPMRAPRCYIMLFTQRSKGPMSGTSPAQTG